MFSSTSDVAEGERGALGLGAGKAKQRTICAYRLGKWFK